MTGDCCYDLTLLSERISDLTAERDACVELENICNGQLETVMGERDALAASQERQRAFIQAQSERMARLEAYKVAADAMLDGLLSDEPIDWDAQTDVLKAWQAARAAIDAQGHGARTTEDAKETFRRFYESLDIGDGDYDSDAFHALICWAGITSQHWSCPKPQTTGGDGND